MNKYIELKQSNSLNVRENGDYSINLDNNGILLEDGDTLQLFKAFLDTKDDQTEKVVIPEDIKLNLKFMYYLVSWENSSINGSNWKTYYGGASTDGEPYILLEKTSINTGYDIITGISYGKISNFTGSKYVGGQTSTFSYIDLNDQPQTIQFKFPREDVNRGPRTVAIEGLSLKTKTDTINDITADSVLQNAGILTKAKTFTGKNNPVISGNTVYQPHLVDKEIIIHEGSYEPDNLAQLITDELVSNSGVLSSGYIDNVFLKSFSNFACKDGTNNGQATDFILVDAETGKKVILWDASNAPVYVGSSQVALQFINNRFQWGFNHIPMYTNETNAKMGIRYITVGTENVVINKHSGVLFTSLSAETVADGKYFDFWEDKLQFDVRGLCVDYQYIDPFSITIGSSLTYETVKITNTLQDGVNTVGQLNTLDSGIQKTGEFFQVPASSIFNNGVGVVGTQPIYAIHNYDYGNNFEFAYYRIDIDSKFQTEILGQQTLFRNTIGILGRYYELNSYLNGTGADGLFYVHRGEPVHLTSFDVRILDSNGNSPSKLGADNTLYLQITKNN